MSDLGSSTKSIALLHRVPFLLCIMALAVSGRVVAQNDCWSNTTHMNTSSQYMVPRDVVNEALVRSAQVGNPFSLTELGWQLDQGVNIPQDLQKAFEFYSLASANGSARASGKLGLMYAQGRGVEVDYAKALELMHVAANAGDFEAQNNLGVMYGQGLGVEKDDEKAFSWYQKSALQGSEVGQFNLGSMFNNGRGVKKDVKNAVEWYQKAARGGDVDAHNDLAVIYRNGPMEFRDMSAAVYYFAVAASLGSPAGQFNLGKMYYLGEGGLSVDKVKAMEYYLMAAIQGNKEAIELLKLLETQEAEPEEI